MKKLLIGLLVLGSFSSFAQKSAVGTGIRAVLSTLENGQEISIEDRLKEIHPSETINFTSPEYMGKSFLAYSGSSKSQGSFQLGHRTYERLCQYLGYSDFLAVDIAIINYSEYLMFVDGDVLVTANFGKHKDGAGHFHKPAKIKKISCRL
jgi:hypothetical protein